MTTIQQFLEGYKREFEELASEFTCHACGNLLEEPKVLPCEHSLCGSCALGPTVGICPTCKEPCKVGELKTNDFSSRIVKILAETKCVLDNVCSEKENISECHSNQGIHEIATAEAANLEDCSFFNEIKDFLVVCSEVKRNRKGETPLHVACRSGQLQKVLELINNNVDLNMKDYAGWTAMHEAVEGARYECIAALLEAGALPNVPGDAYATPLHKAANLSLANIVKLLINYGAKMNCVNYYGLIPLEVASTDEIRNMMITENSEKFIAQKYFVEPKILLHFSSISTQNKVAAKNYTGFKIISSPDFLTKNETTHLILGENEPLSIKALIGILRGIFVARESWIPAYVKTEDKLAIFKYLPRDNTETYKKAVLNALRKQPSLFDGMNFHIADHNTPTTIHGVEFMKQDLLKLIETGGGKILPRAPALRTVEEKCFYPYHLDKCSELYGCANYIIYMETQPPQLLYRMKELRHKSSKWLIDCILNFSVA